MGLSFHEMQAAAQEMSLRAVFDEDLSNYTLCDDGRYEVYTEYADDAVSEVDKHKNITVNDEQCNLTQEENSQYVPFKLPRYWDGVDLMTKLIQFHYVNINGGSGVSTAVNVRFNDSYIICGWLINKSVTAVAGDVTFEITATGTNEKSADYRWRTRPNGKFTVLEALSYDGIIEPSDDWYAGFVKSMQEYTTKAAESAKSARDYADQSKSNLDQVTQITKTFTANAQEVKETAINEINNAKVSGVNAVEAAAAEIVNDREKITENANNISSLKEDMVSFENNTFNKELVGKTKNLLDWSKISKNKIISSDGSLVANNLRWTTDFIPFTDKNRSIISSYLFTSSGGVQSRRERTWTHMACYDDNRNYIDGTYSNVAMSKYTANDETIKFIRLSYNPTQVGNVETDFYLMIEYGTSVNTNVDDYVPYNAGYYEYHLKKSTLEQILDVKTLRSVITINNTDGIEAFYTKMLTAFNTGNCDVYVQKGEYRYTNEIIEKIRADGRRGVPIGNNCRYYFETGANLYCEYTGENKADVVGYFSPLDSQNVGGNFEIYNLDLISKNTCYALHDEANASDDFCKHVYKNCYIKLDNTALGADGNSISKALGGGLGKYEEVIIENCVFKATNPSKASSVQDDASYHSANRSNITNVKLVINGCYFENRFRTSDFDDYPLQTPTPRIIYTNNSSGKADNIPSTWNAYKWNNVVRN